MLTGRLSLRPGAPRSARRSGEKLLPAPPRACAPAPRPPAVWAFPPPFPSGLGESLLSPSARGHSSPAERGARGPERGPPGCAVPRGSPCAAPGKLIPNPRGPCDGVAAPLPSRRGFGLPEATGGGQGTWPLAPARAFGAEEGAPRPVEEQLSAASPARRPSCLRPPDLTATAPPSTLPRWAPCLVVLPARWCSPSSLPHPGVRNLRA